MNQSNIEWIAQKKRPGTFGLKIFAPLIPKHRLPKSPVSTRTRTRTLEGKEPRQTFLIFHDPRPGSCIRSVLAKICWFTRHAHEKVVDAAPGLV